MDDLRTALPAADYLVAAGIAFFIAVGVLVMLRRSAPDRGLPGRGQLRVQIGAVLALLTLGALPVHYWGTLRQDEVETFLRRVAPLLAGELTILGHANIDDTTPSDDPRYRDIQQALLRWVAILPNVSDIYTIRYRDEAWWFVADAPTDYDADGVIEIPREAASAPGDAAEWPDIDQAMQRALAGEVGFVRQVAEDKWGEWVGAWAPIRDRAGRIEAVLGVDFHAAGWHAEARAGRRQATAVVLALTFTLVAGIVAVNLRRRDAHHRRQAEARRAELENKLHDVLESMPFAFIEWHENGTCRSLNGAAERLFGYPRARAIGSRLFDLLAPDPDAALEPAGGSFISRLTSLPEDRVCLTAEQVPIHCLWRSVPMTDHLGRPDGGFTLIEDVTDRRRLDALVQRNDRLRALGQLAGGVAHDINNALSPTLLSLDLLRTTPGVDAQLIELMERGINRCVSLVNRLVTFARGNEIVRQPVATRALLTELRSMMAASFPKDITLHVASGAALPDVVGDPTQLHQVLLNLCVNARDAMPTGGTLRVEVDPIQISAAEAAHFPDASPGRFLAFSVSDTGCGMTPDVIDRMFEPFFTTKTKTGGTGLGLATVIGIMRNHGGFMQVQSTPGRGSTLTAYFPCASDDASEAAASETSTETSVEASVETSAKTPADSTSADPTSRPN